MSVERKIRELDHRTDVLLRNFENRFAGVLSKAQLKTLLNLRSSLSIGESGRIKVTADNARVVRAIPTVFRQSMDASGYGPLMGTLLDEFDGGLPTIESILEEITRGFKIKPVTFTKADRAYFAQIKEGTVLNIDDAVAGAARSARRNVLFSFARQPFEVMAAEISERLHVALGEANTLASTGITTFYRSVSRQGFEKIQKSGVDLEFTYDGPPAEDKLIRPFCARLMRLAAKGRTWTREQIDAMDNGQLPDVMVTGGGYNCRHQWVVALG